MRLLLSSLTAAALAGSAMAPVAQAAPFAGQSAVEQSADGLAAIEKTQYAWGGQNYCWYPDGWRGPGWYWCGYSWRRGFGWGGGYGWHGWPRWRRWLAWRWLAWWWLARRWLARRRRWLARRWRWLARRWRLSWWWRTWWWARRWWPRRPSLNPSHISNWRSAALAADFFWPRGRLLKLLHQKFVNHLRAKLTITAER